MSAARPGSLRRDGDRGLGARFLAAVGLCAFLWTMAEAAAFQELVVPWLFPEAAARGLASPDSWRYLPEAEALAQRIEAEGWGAWSLRPGGSAPVGLTAALYAALGPGLRLVTCVSALFHAGAFLALIAIIDRITGAGRRSVAAALPFLLLPSSILWVSGLAKDGPYILGLYLVVLGLLVAGFGPPAAWAGRTLRALTLAAAGIALAWWVRPYAPGLFAAAAAVAALARLVGSLGPLRSPRAGPVTLAAILLLAGGAAAVVQPSGMRLDVPDPPVPRPPGWETERAAAAMAACWTATPWLPPAVDRELRQVAYTRALLHFEGPDARTYFDRQIIPCSASDVMLAAPRSLLYAVVGPLPTQWASVGGSAPRIAGTALEMAVIYGGLAGLMLFGNTARRPGALLPAVLVALVTVLPFALTLPNFGTLMRFRYGPVLLLVGLGLGVLLESRAGCRRNAREQA